MKKNSPYHQLYQSTVIKMCIHKDDRFSFTDNFCSDSFQISTQLTNSLISTVNCINIKLVIHPAKKPKKKKKKKTLSVPHSWNNIFFFPFFVHCQTLYHTLLYPVFLLFFFNFFFFFWASKWSNEWKLFSIKETLLQKWVK